MVVVGILSWVREGGRERLVVCSFNGLLILTWLDEYLDG